MNIKLFKGAMMALLSFALLSSCVEPEPPAPEPNFPTAITQVMAAGDEVVIAVSPNYDATISLPAELVSYYWINVAGQPAYSYNVKANTSFEIRIHTTDVDYFEAVPSCDVTMTMNGVSKVIATLSRSTIERSFTLYAANYVDGAFVKEDGKYVYSKVESLDLQQTSTTEFTLPVKVESNFDWNISYPEWIASDATSTGVAGTTEFVLVSNLIKLPLKGDSQKIKVQDGTQEITSANITIGAIDGVLEVNINENNLNFDAEGAYKAMGDAIDSPVYGNITSTQNANAFAIGKSADGWYETSYASWVTVTIDEWSGDNMIQTRLVEVKVAKNEGDAREALLFILPESIANKEGFDPFIELFNSDGTEVLPEYAQYAYAISQDGVSSETSWGYITPSSTPEAMQEVGTSFVKEDASHWLSGNFKSCDIYTLTYSKEWSYEEAELQFSKPYDSVVIYNYDVAKVNSPEDYWVTFIGYASNSKGRVYMDPDACTEYGTEAFVEFRDAEGKSLAVIHCIYNESAVIGGSDLVSFAFPDYVKNATIERVTEGDLFDQFYYEYNTGDTQVYQLTYTAPDAEVIMPLLNVPAFTNIIYHSDDDAQWLGCEQQGATQVIITMGGSTAKQGAIIFKDTWMNTVVLICTLAL